MSLSIIIFKFAVRFCDDVIVLYVVLEHLLIFHWLITSLLHVMKQWWYINLYWYLFWHVLCLYWGLSRKFLPRGKSGIFWFPSPLVETGLGKIPSYPLIYRFWDMKKYVRIMKEYVGNKEKFVGNMEKYVESMKEYIFIFFFITSYFFIFLKLGKIPSFFSI